MLQMVQTKKYIAFDLGGSARCVVGSFDGRKLALDVVSRFDNSYVRVLDQVYWDILKLFAGLKQGLQQAQQAYGSDLVSLGVDTMGVAFALLDRQGHLVSNPPYHRLPQTEAILKEAFRRMPMEDIFRITGLQLRRLDSLYHLLMMTRSHSPLLEMAQTFLMLPDVINYWLTGRAACEYTIASTSHLLDAHTKAWSVLLIESMGLPTHLFPEIIEPGQVLAPLHPTVAEETGLRQIPVVATAGHDTAAAIASIPAEGDNYAYLSSGSWGLLGTEISRPILTDKVAAFNFANEGGVSGTIRLLHNGINLWLARECRRIWAREGENHSWAPLIKMAEQAKPFVAFIDPDAPAFKLPEHMPATLQAVCRHTGQSVPQTKGAIIRLILESLAFKYRYALDKLADILGKRPQVLHIVGGGGRNKLLNQFTANALNSSVVAGPYEATSVGNILGQMIATGDLANLDEGRKLVRASFPTETYTPVDSEVWEEQYDRYLKVTGLPVIT
jgi:sugar (pentulose or hexulose) kinase